MVDVNWSFHPLEGIVLAAVLFALYYWIIRLRCHARKAQAFIFAAVLAVSLCSFTSLSVVLDTDKPHNRLPQQVRQRTVRVNPCQLQSPLRTEHGPTSRCISIPTS